jgi:hypothetical protein
MPQTTSFDDDLKAVQSDFEKDLAAASSHVSAGQPVPHPLVAKLLSWLPTVEGAAGGILGTVGGLPGRLTGAALGGAAGAAHEQLGNRLVGNPAPNSATEAMTGMLGQAAIQAGSQGAGEAVTAGMKWAGPALMTSALKPAYAQTEKAIKAVELPRVVRTLLDEGVNVTQRGIGKINTLLKATNDEIKGIIANSRAVVYPERVAAAADDVIASSGRQVAPMADTAASAGVVDEFMRVHGGAPNLPARPIPVQEAQALKQGTYKAIGNRAYGETKGAAIETEKALARGLKEGIETAHPEVKGLNAREGALIEAKDAIAKRVAQAANRDPGGIGWIAENPKSFVAFLLARSPAVKSMLARGLYQSASRASGVPENLIRLGIKSLAGSEGDE